MRLRLLLAAIALVASGGAAGATGGVSTGTLSVSGSGGQQAVLDVPAGGLQIDYRLRGEPRLPGPDGTVGGVIVQRLPDRSLRAAVLLTNAPGFGEQAPGLGLVGDYGARLPQGRYGLTMLGTARHTVTLDLRGSNRRIALAATGPARPITRSVYGSTPVVHEFSQNFQITTRFTLLALSAGAGGPLQQASSTDWCLHRGHGRGVCTVPIKSSRSTSIASSTGAVWETLTLSGSLTRGDFTFSGRAVSAGPGTGAHSVVVVDLPSNPRRRTR